MRGGVSFLLLSGGVGSRSGYWEPKQFRKVKGIELVAYSLRLANAHPEISDIVVNAPEGYFSRTHELCEAFVTNKPVSVIPCGETRQESVCMLAEAARHDTVIVHEAARPLVDSHMIDALLKETCKNAGLFSPIPFSMCEIDAHTGMVSRNIPRKQVFNIQLPQKFCRDTLLKAHLKAKAAGFEFTEDAVLISEMAGAEVVALPGYAKNIKITSPEDFWFVEKYMEEESRT
ncbi:IspD/TarI family cytidylyltransferase [Pararhodobacter oceanensis]|uniref:2-C-methyl-D-erythritol 4-phosphate cytidylyltransferase n=1 Tax=Pararhodobacter oceanensis TaxID=2172121 RepID=A0A2T8HPA8_9RHOB|nr:2-C-methyl-D-erythritol 4-phosphate cytidylyltransferase [Pararhodobacter oceanensis]PVH27269.1 2-C-methyl-D-erythritol 4-phosphate cytidylyltransferase [Pararhodobacter oceanensis]